MYDHDIEIDLDYELMHKQLSMKEYTVREQLNAVIISSTILEIGINQTVEVVIKKIQSGALAEWSKRPFVPISSKITALRFANIIGEDLFHNMNILFRVRNQFAHRLIFSLDESKTIFALMEKAKISNPFLAKLPHDVVKFQLLASLYSVSLLKISEKIDPQSVQVLEATDETVFKKSEDW